MRNFLKGLARRISTRTLSMDVHRPLSESRVEWIQNLGLKLSELGYESEITDWHRSHEVQFDFTCQSNSRATMKIMAQPGGPMEFSFKQPEKLHTKSLLHFSVKDGKVRINEQDSILMKTATPRERDYLQSISSSIATIVSEVTKGGISGMVTMDGAVTVDPATPVREELYKKLNGQVQQLLVNARIDLDEVEVNLEEQEHTDLVVTLKGIDVTGSVPKLDLGIRHTKDGNGQPVKAIIRLVNKKYGNQQGLGVVLEIEDSGDIVARVGRYYSNGEAFRTFGNSEDSLVGDLNTGIAEGRLRKLIGEQMDLYKIYLPISVLVASATYSIQSFINEAQ